MTQKPDAFYRDIGNRVRAARKHVGLRQEDLGVAIGLSRTSIVNIEAGKQRMLVNQLADIAQRLRTPLTNLLPAPGPIKPEKVENWMDDPKLGAMLLDSFRDVVARLRRQHMAKTKAKKKA